MLKTSILLICTLLFAHIANAQRIYFSDSSNQWKTAVISCGGDDHLPMPGVVKYVGDTVINGYTYSIFPHGGMDANNIYVREDTMNKRVYAIYNTYPDYDTAEQLVYDYNLLIGDTFKSKHTTHWVTSIDTVTINGDIYKTWQLSLLNFDSTGSFADYKIVEGIGCLNTPLYPLYPYFFEVCVFEYCFENKGTNPSFSRPLDTFSWDYFPYGWWGVVHFDNDSSCSEGFRLDVKNTTKAGSYSAVVPNPVEPASKIVLPYTLSSGTLYITNEVGQVIEQSSFHNRKELNISSLIKLPGFYCYRVVDNQSGDTFIGKFVYN